jgi:hypothetical protein
MNTEFWWIKVHEHVFGCVLLVSQWQDLLSLNNTLFVKCIPSDF